jgi:hypothetical protein
MTVRTAEHATECLADLRAQYALDPRPEYRSGLWTAAFLLGVDLDEAADGPIAAT